MPTLAISIPFAVVKPALITTPIGKKLFIIKGIAGEVPLLNIYRVVLPFVVARIILIITLVVFPTIAIWLRGPMG
ncbi:MAG: hypothetical protein IIA14_02020 [SAR324 cluster bacterium]|nr:hypothetical protein [SAR324 cluster bacterium]